MKPPNAGPALSIPKCNYWTHVACSLRAESVSEVVIPEGIYTNKRGHSCLRVLVNCRRWRNLWMTLLWLIQTLILWLPKRVRGALLVPAQAGQKLSVKWKCEGQCVPSPAGKGFSSTSGLNREFGDSLWHLGEIATLPFPTRKGTRGWWT